ncbi:MAG: PatB family C-S lyase [Verrucomicrobiota bacterium]|nr:PatB family C-S lyase [Verrucomicrobiota bacterium]
MQYNFDTFPSRKNTGSLKWEKYAGRDVLPLWVADMDFQTAPEIIAALQQRLEHGIYGYTLPYTDVIDAVRNYLSRTYAWEVSADWICWTPGLVPALNVMCRAVGAEGDAVITATPVYPPFLSSPDNTGRELIAVPLMLEGERWTLDLVAMEHAITPRTRLLSLCNPHNPVGRVFSREELSALAVFAAKHDLVVCSDEIHCDLILDEVTHIPFATLSPEVAARTVTLMAPSKTYNIPGLSCSFAIISDAKLRGQFKKAAQGFLTEVNCFGYAGCAAAYNFGEPWRQALLAYLRANRATLYAFIHQRLPELRILPMEATYLAWIDCRSLGFDDPAGFFEKFGAGLSDGRYFGAVGKGYVRLNFGCPRSQLLEGLERMERALQSLR